jgi:hypothetical protein
MPPFVDRRFPDISTRGGEAAIHGAEAVNRGVDADIAPRCGAKMGSADRSGIEIGDAALRGAVATAHDGDVARAAIGKNGEADIGDRRPQMHRRSENRLLCCRPM